MSQEVFSSEQHEGSGVVVPARDDGEDKHSSLLREVLQTLILTVLVFFIFRILIQPVYVNGPSMQPGLHTGEWVLVNKVAFDFHAPQRGDVVVFYPPSDTHELYVKRLIGLPGDTIRITHNAVYVDNHQLSEPYIYPLAPGEVENTQVVPSMTLAAGQYFMLGDHRQNSDDSRYFGVVPKQNLIGMAQVVVWPFADREWIPTYSSVFSAIK